MRTTLVTIACLGGCLGGASSISGPTAATVIYALPDHSSCDNNNGMQPPDAYLGGVAIGSSFAFIGVSAAQNTCNGGMSSVDALIQVGLAGGDPGTPFGFAGAQNNQEIHVGSIGDDPIFTYAPASAGALVAQVGSGSAFAIASPQGGNGTVYPADAIDGGDAGVWVASFSGFQGMEDPFDDPGFPDGQFLFGPTGQQGGSLVLVAPDGTVPLSAGLGSGQSWACSSMPDCLALDGGSAVLAIVDDNTGGGTSIPELVVFSTGGSLTEQVVEPLPVMVPGGGPMGLASSGTHAVWVEAQEPIHGGAACEVWARDLVGNTDTELLDTTAFSCAGASADGSAAYFTITHYNNKVNNGVVDGIGLGRVSFDDHTVETLATGILGNDAGARRVYVVGDTMYAVDPHVLASIPTSALDGKHDFGP